MENDTRLQSLAVSLEKVHSFPRACILTRLISRSLFCLPVFVPIQLLAARVLRPKGLETSSIGITWGFVRNAHSWAPPDLLNQNLHFNKIRRVRVPIKV